MSVLNRSMIASVLFGVSLSATADVLVEAGYYDLAGGSVAGGSPYALPNPWYGSPNTTFLGSASLATNNDPDESAVLIANTGPTAVTLSQGITIGGLKLWDSYIPVSGLTIAAGHNVILSGTAGGYLSSNLDGSDGIFANGLIDLTINGKAYSFSTSALPGYPSVNNETLSWTLAGTISTVPEPSELLLLSTGLLAILGRAFKKSAIAC